MIEEDEIMDLSKDRILDIWFIIMYVLVAIFAGWNVYGVTHGTSTGYRYGLPLFSGLPKQAQEAVLIFNKSYVGQQEAVINVSGVSILVVNMTINQATGFSPNLIVAEPNEPVVLQIYSPQVITGFYMILPSGVVQINTVPGMPTYEYFVTPNTPHTNYTFIEPEYAAYNFSYWNGTLEVV